MRRVRDPLSFGCGLLVIGSCLQMLFSLWYGVAAMMLCRMRSICCWLLCSWLISVYMKVLLLGV